MPSEQQAATVSGVVARADNASGFGAWTGAYGDSVTQRGPTGWRPGRDLEALSIPLSAVIELRRKIELAVAHPVLGPVVIVLLAVLLALVFIHVIQEDSGVAAGIGAICFGIVTVLGAVLRERLRLETPVLVVMACERGPPAVPAGASLRPRSKQGSNLVLPLRR